MAAFGATATRVVTASFPLCSNSDGWLDDHYAGAKRPGIRKALKTDGTWMAVEPTAGDTLEDNINPVGRPYHSPSHPPAPSVGRD